MPWWNRIWGRAKGDDLPGHLRTGLWGEQEAETLLKGKGYRILGRRVRVGRRDEIDLIARDDSSLVFVEVKTRRNADFGRPGDAVAREKQRTLSRAALRYMNRLNPRPDYFRFDVVEVIGNEETGADEIRHVEGAFPMDSRYRISW